jgi:cytosine/adenosine deaminase-related metal-dependent hydrolase
MLTLHNADQLETARRENVKGVSFGLSLPPAEELTTYNLQASLRLSRDAGYPLVAHLGETTKDAEFVFRNFRKGTVQILEEFGIFESGCLLLHGGITDAADIERLKQRGISPVIAPGSALRKGIDPPRSDLLRSHNIATAICTDWGPFLHWNAIRTAQTIASHQGAPPYSGLELLRALTARPAELVDMSSEFGTISPGKRANLQLVKCRNLELQAGLEILPPESVAQMMIQRTATSDVSDVMVNGEFNVREGTILTYSEDDILGDAQSLLARSGAPGRVHTSTQLVEIDTPESTEDHDDGLGDEGFRILKKGDRSLAPATILPLEPSRDGERDLPKSVRRIFGEDEL